VGCGRVANHHARFIARSNRATLVGVADANEANARDLANRYGLTETHASIESLLDQVRLDVLHVLTPPALHVAYAELALQRGIHVIVEKPIAYSAADVARLYDLAERNKVLLCPNFIQLFTPVTLKARALVEAGEIGDVVHVECYQSLDLDIPDLRESLGAHWSLSLPGGILRNYLTHPLYLVLHWMGEPRR
jgi:predicted dehydrogenase